MFLFIIRLLTWSQKWSFRDDLDSGLCWYLLIGRSHPVEKDWDDSPSLIVQERCHGIPMDFRVAFWLGGPVIFLSRPYLPQEGQIKWKKHKKSWPFPKLIFCHQWSLLDWTRMIQALFCVPGPHRGRGGPILGFGGPEGSKIWNFQTGPLLTVRCNFFDLNSL